MNAASMPGQHVVDGALVDVARDRAALGPLEVGLGDLVVLEHGDTLLADVDRDQQLALGGRQRRARSAACGAAGRAACARRVAARRRPRLLGSRRVWVFGLASASALAEACVEVVPAGRLRPRPPRLPRRRFLGAVSVRPACAGGEVTFSAGAGAAGSAVRARSSVGDLVRLNNRSKRNLLVGRARFGRPRQSGGARAACGSNSSA